MTRSLRLRLFLIILIPLLVLASAVGGWRLVVAQRTAQELFDRNLMFSALAVARDFALAEGDAILPATEQLLAETAGGPVRYHVYAPDGVYVTGYAVPPVPISRKLPEAQAFAYYDATYKGAPVRVLRLRDEATIADLSGTFTITVWQDLSARNAFVTDLALRALAIIGTLLLAVGLLVWFGVRQGLKPLLDLEDAISRRSPEDLSPIRRAVPVETHGIVARLNALFARVSTTLEAQNNFVSDAAHQLRNPIAGLRALAEATTTAPDLDTARRRAAELTRAAAETGDLADRLLTLERARAEAGVPRLQPVDLTHLVKDLCTTARRPHPQPNVTLTCALPDRPVMLPADPVMLREALTNLIDNAYAHGGPDLGKVHIAVETTTTIARITIADDGPGVTPQDIPRILARFGQGHTSAGSGLGLSIAEAVARRHGGTLQILSPDTGFTVQITLPLT